MLKVQEIREIIKLIDQSSISEFTYETNGTTVSMKKTTENNSVQTEGKPIRVIEHESAETEKTEVKVKPEESKPADSEPEAKQESIADYDYEIESPMVGTFYIASTPESDPFVAKGSKVEKDTVVCIVEAMKLFNEIEAEVSGEITEILVEDGELVEYGQPMFRVKAK
ncbi:acetyl-CoA carboxylase, biotin carboxyl carrier protein [Virgibacillus profundi]|uniref:Biotin carboxyl carrier protein of acetyl-CoA carboxylase n=1 Tax=Virgibacillus profundi TaxID=2024555 RepID=A0A2A2IDF3_9BACI|nr:acetyl-CoA carboxylase biotin carboxyl carrier protein [Virgibacillus profundi]PAV29103.1 acetyl-CoA carboxylase, biotin carboxyl carrier protein [Virgibacillus profundi]PXY53272.1 acetyl-CoA carboxylase biotin carboxyl carrier protein [Virgibacillus profundi]